MNTGLNTSKPRHPLPYIRIVSVPSVVKISVSCYGAGLGDIHPLFGERMDPLIADLNKELTA